MEGSQAIKQMDRLGCDWPLAFISAQKFIDHAQAAIAPLKSMNI